MTEDDWTHYYNLARRVFHITQPIEISNITRNIADNATKELERRRKPNGTADTRPLVPFLRAVNVDILKSPEGCQLLQHLLGPETLRLSVSYKDGHTFSADHRCLHRASLPESLTALQLKGDGVSRLEILLCTPDELPNLCVLEVEDLLNGFVPFLADWGRFPALRTLKIVPREAEEYNTTLQCAAYPCLREIEADPATIALFLRDLASMEHVTSVKVRSKRPNLGETDLRVIQDIVSIAGKRCNELTEFGLVVPRDAFSSAPAEGQRLSFTDLKACNNMQTFSVSLPLSVFNLTDHDVKTLAGAWPALVVFLVEPLCYHPMRYKPGPESLQAIAQQCPRLRQLQIPMEFGTGQLERLNCPPLKSLERLVLTYVEDAYQETLEWDERQEEKKKALLAVGWEFGGEFWPEHPKRGERVASVHTVWAPSVPNDDDNASDGFGPFDDSD